MTQQEFNAKATELIKAMVNAIADKDFLAWLPVFRQNSPGLTRLMPKRLWRTLVLVSANGWRSSWHCGKRTTRKSLWWTLSIPDVSTILMNWMRKGSLSIPITPPALANSWISGLKLSFKVENKQIIAVFDINI